MALWTFRLKALRRCPTFSSDLVDTSRTGEYPTRAAASCNSVTFFFFCEGANPGCQVIRSEMSLTRSGESGAGMNTGRSAIGKIPYQVERYRPWNQNFILLSRLQTLLHRSEERRVGKECRSRR